MSDPAETPMARLVRRLDVAPTGGDRFAAEASCSGGGRLFGGQVAAQAAIAAGRTVDGPALHSLHGHFLRAGRNAAPIRYEVERTRDGRRFSSRRVIALQDERPIFAALASFTRVHEGASHQDPPPTLPPPDDAQLLAALVVYASDRTLLRTAGRPHGLAWGERPHEWFSFDCRSPAAFAGRGLVFGAMHGVSGRLFASVAQEGLLET